MAFCTCRRLQALNWSSQYQSKLQQICQEVHFLPDLMQAAETYYLAGMLAPELAVVDKNTLQ